MVHGAALVESAVAMRADKAGPATTTRAVDTHRRNSDTRRNGYVS
jgi:hypothetical protein